MTIPSTKTIRVLLVDDHQSFMDGLAMVINTHPRMEIIGMACNSAEALKIYNEQKPGLILLDMDLNGENGMDLLPYLSQQTDTKILMITGLRNLDLHENAISKGARGVILKDESAASILKAIEKVSAGEIWASKTILGRVFEKFTHSPNIGKFDSEAKKIGELTSREREIITTLLSFESSTNEEIADHLCISQSTLKNHLTTIYSKLEVKNRVQLMKYALTHQLTK
jgi:two-component system nitrate/nitrite response regulator NarL